jgi:hypothetical protein
MPEPYARATTVHTQATRPQPVQSFGPSPQSQAPANAPASPAPAGDRSVAWPAGIVLLLGLGFLFIALVQLDLTIDAADFEEDTRNAFRSLGTTVGTLLVAGGLLIGGAVIRGIPPAARAAAVIAGAVLTFSVAGGGLLTLIGAPGL